MEKGAPWLKNYGNVPFNLEYPDCSMYELVAKLGVKHPFFNRFNYETYGGTPVLGVTAPVIIGHGVSTPLAIKNMILQGEMVVRQGLIEKFKSAMLGNV